jgi:hypothetical protein
VTFLPLGNEREPTAKNSLKKRSGGGGSASPVQSFLYFFILKF